MEPTEAIATGTNACLSQLNTLFLFFTHSVSILFLLLMHGLLFVVTYTEISNHNTTEDQNPFVLPKKSEYWLLLYVST